MSRKLLKISQDETPKPVWAFSASAPLPTQHRSSAWCSEGTSRAPVCQLPFVLALDITEKSLALSSSHPPFRYLDTFRHIGGKIPLEPSLLQDIKSHLSQPFISQDPARFAKLQSQLVLT